MEWKEKRGLMSAMSPARRGAMSSLSRKGKGLSEREVWSMVRSGSVRPEVEALESLREGPEPGGAEMEGPKRSGSGLGRLMTGPLRKAPSVVAGRGSDLRLLLGVMGAPLASVPVGLEDSVAHLSIKDGPMERLSAQYILHQYTAASGGQKLLNSVGNAYAMGKVKMLASTFETTTGVKKSTNSSRDAQSGGFVLWQMNPGKWYVELAVGNGKVRAGCDGKLVWRHTPWLGAHPAKGPVRPLRRALQGLDPRTTASIFTGSRFVGEKRINGEDCFILKLCADPETLKARSDGPAEIIRHAMVGHFSQKTGLLINLEDSHLTRIQTIGGDAVYWETTINSFTDEYRPAEGIMIAHSGRSTVTVFKFGETAMSHSKTIMEEAWTIEEVAYNVPGLSEDCFIPPSDLRSSSISENPGRGAEVSKSLKIGVLDKEPEERSEGASLKVNV